MSTTHSIQIISNQMLLLDENDNGCDGHLLTSLAAAQRQLQRWREQYTFDYSKAIDSVSAFFRQQAADKRGVDAAFERIAQEVLHIPTLRTRDSDGLDFHDIGVASLRLALQAAYEAGRQASK